MKKRVSDLEGWVPEPGGSTSDGFRVPGPAEVLIERVLKVFDDHVMFSCRFIDTSTEEPKAQSLFYDFRLLNQKTLPKIVEILNNNVGKPLLSIGTIEVSRD